MNGECCGSREEGQANDIPATLVVVYYSLSSRGKITRHEKTGFLDLYSDVNVTFYVLICFHLVA